MIAEVLAIHRQHAGVNGTKDPVRSLEDKELVARRFEENSTTWAPAAVSVAVR
jgi:hypothetical protein